MSRPPKQERNKLTIGIYMSNVLGTKPKTIEFYYPPIRNVRLTPEQEREIYERHGYSYAKEA
jgi:hypothetical protein